MTSAEQSEFSTLYSSDTDHLAALTRLQALRHGNIIEAGDGFFDPEIQNTAQAVALQVQDLGVIRQSEDTLILPFTNEDQYQQAITSYLKKHTDNTGAIGGGGMISLLSNIKDLSDYLEAVQSYRESLNVNYVSVLSQPLLLDAKTVDDATADNVLDAIRKKLILGVVVPANIFQDVQRRYDNQDIEGCFLAVRGKYDEVLKSLEEGDPDLLFFSEKIDTFQVHSLRNARLNRIRGEAGATESPNEKSASGNGEKPKINIGVIGLQGAYEMEVSLIDQAVREMNGELTFEVGVQIVRTRKEINALDAVFLPGGWHGPQFELYSEMGLIEPIRQLLQRGGHLYGSCAGAILLRNPEKPSDGCMLGTELNILDMGIDNGCLTGPVKTKIRFGSSHVDRIGNYSAAPEMTHFGDNIKEIGVAAHRTIAVLDEATYPGVLAASSLHSVEAIKAWLAAIAKKRIDMAAAAYPAPEGVWR